MILILTMGTNTTDIIRLYSTYLINYILKNENHSHHAEKTGPRIFI